MAGIILNLASLKAKADAAGVANTANNTTPNLCPLKSAIAEYVTNGATVVSISGTWANNLLVEDACVAVNKTITGTTTVYRNVSAGSQQGGADIPASGGSSRVYKVVTYEYATQTNYSDGTSTTNAYTSESYTVYGSLISANSLGTTVKSRTKIGTSSATETVAGTSVSVSGDIYLEANYITKIEATTLENVSTHVIYSNMSADGGTVTPSGTGRCKYTFKSGSTETTGSTSPFTGVTATYTRSYSLSNNPNGVFSINSSTGAVTAGANTSTTNTRVATIAAVLTVSISYSSTFSSLTKPSNSTITHYPTCTLNKKDGPTSESYTINATYNVNNIPYYGGTCERPYLTSIVLYHIVDGTPVSSTSLSESNISIVGYANNSTGTAPDADSSYTSEGYKYTMSLNASTSQLTGNWIFMRFKYTPSGWTLLTYTYKKLVKQNGNPGSGFTLIVNNPVPPANIQNPTVVFCDGSKSLRYLIGSWYSSQTKMNASWKNSGAVLKIYIVMNSDASSLYTDYKYLKITGVTESGAPLAILNKTNIRNYFTSNTDNESDLIPLTNSFNTSDFDSGGPAQIILTFTTS